MLISREGDAPTLQGNNPLGNELPGVLRGAGEDDVADPDSAEAGGKPLHQDHVAGDVEGGQHAGPVHLQQQQHQKPLTSNQQEEEEGRREKG